MAAMPSTDKKKKSKQYRRLVEEGGEDQEVADNEAQTIKGTRKQPHIEEEESKKKK